MNYKINSIDAYKLFYDAYIRGDDTLEDVFFDSLMDVIEEFELELSYHQKEKVGSYLLEEYESELEEYRDYLIKSDHESLEEEISVEDDDLTDEDLPF